VSGQHINLSSIRRDGGTQMRASISETTAVSYAEHMREGAEFPPIVVFDDGEYYWLADGFHRFSAYERAGIEDVPADVREGSLLDAVVYALRANATNGRPRTSDDLRRAYQVAVDNELCDPTDSNAVAELLHCSVRWARELTEKARNAAQKERDERIVHLHENGWTQRAIADDVGCGRDTVNQVVRKRKSFEVGQEDEVEPDDTETTGDELDEAIERDAKQRRKKKHARKREERKQAAHDEQVESAAGSISLYQEDIQAFASRFDAESIDLLLTDPPYATEFGDDFGDFSRWVEAWLPKIKKTGRAYIFTGAYPLELQAYLNCLLGANGASKYGFEVDNILVWTYRNTLGPSPKLAYKNNWQACFYLRGSEADPLNCPQMTEQFSVQDINAPDARTGVRWHEWQKPDEIAERLIRHSTEQGQLVVDPFCGTGTFIAAASRLGRDAIGSDVSEEMLALCRERGLEWTNAA